MRRRLATPAALAVLMLSLTACVGDDGTGPITEAPSYPNQGSDDGGESPEVSDGGGDEQAAPDIPAPDPADYPGMEENTPEGAEQAFLYYMDVVWWSHQVGDSEILSGLATDECSVCASTLDDVALIGETGSYWSAFEVEVELLDVKAAEDGDGVDFVVSYLAVVGGHDEPDPESGDVTARSDARYSIAAGLLWQDGKWLVDGMAAESSDV